MPGIIVMQAQDTKDKIILGLGIFCLLLFLVTLNSCVSAHRYRVNLDKEKAANWDLAQKIEESKYGSTNLENNLKSKTQELEAEKVTHEADQKALLQEQLLNKSLKEELDKVVKLKEALERDLREALAGAKSIKTKK